MDQCSYAQRPKARQKRTRGSAGPPAARCSKEPTEFRPSVEILSHRRASLHMYMFSAGTGRRVAGERVSVLSITRSFTMIGGLYMRKLAIAVAVFILPLVVFVNIASADRPTPARTVDFTARLNGSTSSLGRTGVVVKIQSAAIANDGTITVRATIVDADGQPARSVWVWPPRARCR